MRKSEIRDLPSLPLPAFPPVTLPLVLGYLDTRRRKSHPLKGAQASDYIVVIYDVLS